MLKVTSQQLLKAIQGLKTEEDILTKQIKDLNKLKANIAENEPECHAHHLDLAECYCLY